MTRLLELDELGDVVLEARCGCMCLADERCPHCGCCGRADVVDWSGCCRCPAAAARADRHVTFEDLEMACERWAGAAAARIAREVP